jgi:arginase
MRIALIQVPYHLGHEGIGMGAGPDRLVEAGAAQALSEAGHEVDVVRVRRQNGETNEIGAAFEVLRRTADAVADADRAGAFPLVLSGNCMVSIAVAAGLQADVGVVWLDAHADFNTTDSSRTGFADGMGLSILTGSGWRALRETVPGYRAVAEANVALIGIRDLDPPEQKRLDDSVIEVVRPTQVDEVDRGLAPLADRVSDVYLHLDLDVLDPSEGRANEYAAEGGLRAQDVERVVALTGELFQVRAASITAYDPALDHDGRVAAAGIAFGARIAEVAGARAKATAR